MSTQQQQLAAYQQVVANFRALNPEKSKAEINQLAYLYQLQQKGMDEATMERLLSVKQTKQTIAQEKKEYLKTGGVGPFVPSVTLPKNSSGAIKQYHDWARQQKLNGRTEAHSTLVSEAKGRFLTNPEEFRSVEEIEANPTVLPKKAAVRAHKEFVPIEGIESTLASLSTMMKKKATISDSTIKHVNKSMSDAERKKQRLLELSKAATH